MLPQQVGDQTDRLDAGHIQMEYDHLITASIQPPMQLFHVCNGFSGHSRFRQAIEPVFPNLSIDTTQ
jgi:hypothetical protein